MSAAGPKRRAAATEAAQKIKGTVAMISTWSDGDSTENSLVCNSSDFDETDCDSGESKKRNVTHKPKQKTKEVAKNSVKTNAKKAPTTTKKIKQHREALPTKVSKSSKYSIGLTTSKKAPESDRKERERRRAARQVQSNRPMQLSRRLSYKISQSDLSPQYSPIMAHKLRFSPEVILLVSRN